jgi:hypothetical protein
MILRAKLLAVISLVALCLHAAPASAELWVVFDIDGTKMTMTNEGSTHAGDITIDPDALYPEPYLIADIVESTTGIPQDRVWIDGAELIQTMLAMHLDFAGSGQNWTATGDLLIRDYDGSDRVKAEFVSSSVSVQGGNLDIAGSLKTVAGATSVLVPGSDPWTFKGEGGSGGADTVVDTITVPSNVDQYLGGTVVVMHYALPVGIGSLEDVFSLATGTDVLRGDLDVTITPVPAAVLLGMLGMSVAGFKLRRFA